jgi:hypothetical protein
MEENADVKLALEEMRLNMQQSLSAGEALDQKVNLILVASGLVFAVATTLQISLNPSRSDLYWAVLIGVICLYIASVALALWGAGPQPYRLPLASDWDELTRVILGRAERDALTQLLSGYVEQIQHNRKINRTKAAIFRICLAILLVTVLTLVVLVFIP